MRKGLKLEGYRPDGVILVNLGDRQMSLVNVCDHVKTAALSEVIAGKFGPWKTFAEAKPDDTVRALVLAVVEQPGNLVPPSAVGALDFDYRELDLTGPTRQEFMDMLQTANLDVSAELPETQNFQDDPAFLQHCLSEIVPGLTAAGVVVDNPNSFCALLHLERNGIMPRGVAGVTAPTIPPQPVAEASAVPVMAPAVPAVAMSDDGPSNVALGVKPGEQAIEEPNDPLATDDESAEDPDSDEERRERGETDLEDDADPVAAKVAEINDALDEASGLVQELIDMLGVPASEEFENADRSLALAAKLRAIREFGKDDEPPADVVSAAAPLPPVPATVMADVPGKPELPPADVDKVEAPPVEPKGSIGKPNKKKLIEGCGTEKPTV